MHPSTRRCPRPAPTGSRWVREVVDLGDRVVSPPLRAEPVASTGGSPPRRSVPAPASRQAWTTRSVDGGDPQPAQLAARLGDHPLAAPAAGGTCRSLSWPATVSRNALDPDRASTGRRSARPRPAVRAPVLPRTRSHATRQKRRVSDEVEQVVEPAAEDRRTPNGAAWSGSSVPVVPPGQRTASGSSVFTDATS